MTQSKKFPTVHEVFNGLSEHYFSAGFLNTPACQLFSMMTYDSVFCPLTNQTYRGGIRMFDRFGTVETYYILPDGRIWLENQIGNDALTSVPDFYKQRPLAKVAGIGQEQMAEYLSAAFSQEYPLFKSLIYNRLEGVFCPFINKKGKTMRDIFRCAKIGEHTYCILPSGKIWQLGQNGKREYDYTEIVQLQLYAAIAYEAEGA